MGSGVGYGYAPTGELAAEPLWPDVQIAARAEGSGARCRE